MSDDNEHLLDHEYDGIREYDNPMPGWWKGIFVITILFAPLYAWWFHFGGPGSSEHKEFTQEWASYQAWKASADEDAAVVVTEELLAQWSHQASTIAAGRDIFVKNCVGCHLDDARGQIGPNLTDAFQLHGTTRLDLYATIRDGVPANGMAAWGQTMKPREMATVAAYVSTLRGHPMPDGKPPQGEKVAAFP